MDSLKLLEQRLQHCFNDASLLKLALTHSSSEQNLSLPRGTKNKPPRHCNEKLEFLGDRVLGLVVADILYQQNPLAGEGELSRRLMALVREEQLARIGRDLKLAEFLIISSASEQRGIQHQNRTLADAVEAIIAALYLDGGFDAAKQFIIRAMGEAIDNPATAERDPKSALQEWGMARGLGLPDYQVVQVAGSDHEPRFSATVTLDASTARGEGSTKKEAQVAAATLLLNRLTPLKDLTRK